LTSKYENVVTWSIYHDDGEGATSPSMALWDSLKGKLGKVYSFSIIAGRQFSVEIIAEHGIVLLSGLNCGYGGTGPHGTQKLLKSLKIPEHIYTQRLLDRKTFGQEKFMLDLKGYVSW